MIRERLETCWLKVSNIPRRVKLRDLWELLTAYAPVHQVLVEDPLPHLGRDCIVQVSDIKAAKVLISASTQNRIKLGLNSLRVQESEDPSTITKIIRDKQKPSQRRLFLMQVPKIADVDHLGLALIELAGAFESLKQVRFHPSELATDRGGSEFQVLTVLFMNCNQVDFFLSGKLDLTKHPQLAGVRFQKYLGLRYEKDSHYLNSNSTQADINASRSRNLSELAGFSKIPNDPQSLILDKQKSLVHNLRLDINDHHHRLKPTSRKYFLRVAKRSIDADEEQQNLSFSNYSFNIACHNKW